jgi:hypothetical protein
MGGGLDPRRLECELGFGAPAALSRSAHVTSSGRAPRAALGRSAGGHSALGGGDHVVGPARSAAVYGPRLTVNSSRRGSVRTPVVDRLVQRDVPAPHSFAPGRVLKHSTRIAREPLPAPVLVIPEDHDPVPWDPGCLVHGSPRPETRFDRPPSPGLLPDPAAHFALGDQASAGITLDTTSSSVSHPMAGSMPAASG